VRRRRSPCGLHGRELDAGFEVLGDDAAPVRVHAWLAAAAPSVARSTTAEDASRRPAEGWGVGAGEEGLPDPLVVDFDLPDEVLVLEVDGTLA
jgi:hypothetical protein